MIHCLSAGHTCAQTFWLWCVQYTVNSLHQHIQLQHICAVIHACQCTPTVCVCVQIHLHAACLMVYNLRQGLFRSSDQRAAPQLLTFSFGLRNHRALTPDTKAWWRLRYSVGHRTVSLFPSSSSFNFLPLICFLFLCLFLDCSLPKCESKLDGPGQTSGRCDCQTVIFRNFLHMICLLLMLNIIVHVSWKSCPNIKKNGNWKWKYSHVLGSFRATWMATLCWELQTADKTVTVGETV